MSRADRLKVVVVDEELPFPATSGKRIRTLNLVTRLARRHDITYLAHRNRDIGEAQRAAAHLREYGIETITVERTIPSQSGLAFYARLAANLLSPLPYSVATHNSRQLNEAVRQYAAGNHVDLWQCEWTPYAAALSGVGAPAWLVMAHNVESLIWRRYYETETNAAKRWYIKGQWDKFERFERAMFAQATRTVAVSEADAELARHEYAARAVAVVDNGVDTEFFCPAEEPPRGHRILFLGSLDWRPNLDAVKILIEDVFLLVRASQGDAELDIVGRNPPTWLRKLAGGHAGVRLHADVADVRPYLHAASVMAVPLRIGGGSRLKILEALSCRLPVVSTRVGCEGLDLEDGEHLAIADQPRPFADALVRMMRERDTALAMAERGRNIVLSRYDWDILADRLDAVWRGCVGHAAPELAGAAT